MGQALERVDPTQRTLTGANAGRVKNRNPDREYALANQTDDMFGYDALLDEGWKPVISGSDKETVTGGRKIEGDKIAWRGQVLMWRPRKDHEAFLAEKAQFHARLEAKKQQPGGPDGVTDPKGNAAEQFAQGKAE
jgi:hypothetical protein